MMMMMMKDRSRFVLLLLFRVSVGVGIEGYETNWLYLIENNDENLAEKRDSVCILGMFGGEEQGRRRRRRRCATVPQSDDGIIPTLCIRSGWFHDYFSFLPSYTVSWVATSR